MGRKLFAMTAAVMLMASVAVAQTSMCLYPDGGCWPNPVAECNTNWGWVFNGGLEGAGTFCEGGTYNRSATTNRGNVDPPTGLMPVLGCCLWASSGAFDNVRLASGATDCNGGANTWWAGIECGPDDLDGNATRPAGNPTYDGSGLVSQGCCRWAANNATGACWNALNAAEAADCQTGANTYWSVACPVGDGVCPTTPPVYDGSSLVSLGCCRWADENPTGQCWDVYTAAEAADCQSGTNEFWSGACPATPGTCPGQGNIIGLCGRAASSAALRASYNRGSVSVNWNPTSRISSGTISLVNVRGVTVASTSVRASSNNVSATLGTKAALPTGMYFIRVDARDVSGKRIVQQVPVQIVK